MPRKFTPVNQRTNAFMLHDSNSYTLRSNPSTTTDWWKGAVIYQIYPRSFQDSNADGVGDLVGITQRLPYITQLGVDAIWICPFYASPMHDGGYDVSDYRAVHPLFGSLHDFDLLVQHAHTHNLRVMIDLVLSHTSNEHTWFAQSAQNRCNPYADWYVWADGKSADGHHNPMPPNNWQSLFGGSAWQWHEGRQQFYLHNFWASQPDLNFHHAPVQDAVLDVVRFWLDRGVDGFRIDTANYFFHDDQLRDNPPAEHVLARADGLPNGTDYATQQHIYDKSRPENLVFLSRLRTLIDSYQDRALLAEIGDDHALERMAEYTHGSDRFHMAYSFHLLEGNFEVHTLKQLLTDIDHGLADGWPCWSLSNHDVPRVVSRWFPHADLLQQSQLGIVLMALLLSLRGSVCLYQGDELGLNEAEVPFEMLQDAFGIAHWPKFKGRDGCRTPMPWDGQAFQSGFTEAKTAWLPISESHNMRSAKVQSADHDSILTTTQRLIQLRKSSAALRLGSIALSVYEDQCLCIKRCLDDQSIFIFLNFSSHPVQIDDACLRGYVVIENILGCTGQWIGNALSLPALSVCYLQPANSDAKQP